MRQRSVIHGAREGVLWRHHAHGPRVMHVLLLLMFFASLLERFWHRWRNIRTGIASRVHELVISQRGVLV